MICRFCGNSIPDGTPFCPKCGNVLRDRTEKSSILYENLYEKPMAVRYFFTPVLLGLFSGVFSFVTTILTGRLGTRSFVSLNLYRTALSWMVSLSALIRGLLFFLISWHGKEQSGRKIILIVSLVFAFIPALTAPWMLPLFSASEGILREIPQTGMMFSLLIASLLGAILGFVLKPKSIWPYIAAAILAQALLFVLGSLTSDAGSIQNQDARLLVYGSFILEHFAFYTFPCVGLAAAWTFKKPSYFLVSTDEYHRTFVLEVKNPANLPADPALELPVPGFSVLGFAVPVAGLILYICWHQTFPGRARSAGKGAIAGAVFYIVTALLSAALLAKAL